MSHIITDYAIKNDKKCFFRQLMIMNKRLSIIFYMCFLLSLTLCISCKSNKSTSTTKSDIVKKLAIDKTHYLLREKIIVRIYLKNNTKEELVISDRPTEEVQFFIYHDGLKKLSKKDPVIYDKPTTKESFLKIKPKSEILYSTIEFDKEYFNQVGQWEFYIFSRYGFSGEDLGFNAWQGIVKSNVLTIQIKDSVEGKKSK